MIGGTDIIIPGLTTRFDVAFIIRGVRQFWRKAVVESPHLSCPMVVDEPNLYPIPRMDECFIYSSRAAFESWERAGRTDQNADHLIYLVLESDAICLTIDNTTSKTSKIVQEVVEGLEHHRKRGYRHVRRAA